MSNAKKMPPPTLFAGRTFHCRTLTPQRFSLKPVQTCRVIPVLVEPSGLVRLWGALATAKPQSFEWGRVKILPSEAFTNSGLTAHSPHGEYPPLLSVEAAMAALEAMVSDVGADKLKVWCKGDA